MLKFNEMNIKIWSRLGSCGAFGIAAVELGESNKNVVMITADLCNFAGIDRFKVQYQDRFFNMGIAEQNMLGVAAGMAKEGFIPFVTSYATFATMRAADQVRVNMGYMRLPVKCVGLTSGFSVGVLGPTHICIEDIALIRSIPNILILSPADCTETIKATIAAADYDGPVYIRLTGTMNNPIVYKEDYDFEIGKAITLREGKDIAIISTGSMIYNSLKVAQKLEEYGISVKVINMHTIKPLDKQAIMSCINHNMIVTVEEHSKFGGLGSVVAEELANIDIKPRQLIIGIDDKFMSAGEYAYLLEEYGLTVDKITENIIKNYKKKEI